MYRIVGESVCFIILKKTVSTPHFRHYYTVETPIVVELAECIIRTLLCFSSIVREHNVMNFYSRTFVAANV